MCSGNIQPTPQINQSSVNPLVVDEGFAKAHLRGGASSEGDDEGYESLTEGGYESDDEDEGKDYSEEEEEEDSDDDEGKAKDEALYDHSDPYIYETDEDADDD